VTHPKRRVAGEESSLATFGLAQTTSGRLAPILLI
jgi:hypothetical protein